MQTYHGDTEFTEFLYIICMVTPVRIRMAG
jgi:hypothetical protein